MPNHVSQRAVSPPAPLRHWKTIAFLTCLVTLGNIIGIFAFGYVSFAQAYLMFTPSFSDSPSSFIVFLMFGFYPRVLAEGLRYVYTPVFVVLGGEVIFAMFLAAVGRKHVASSVGISSILIAGWVLWLLNGGY